MKALFAWELGGGLGHVLPLMRTGRYFSLRQSEPIYVLADVSAAPDTNSAQSVLQAPVCKRQLVTNVHTPETFADVLMPAGYGDANMLGSLLNAWRSIFDLVRPDVVIADFAPTALLAANVLAIPTLAMGNGFCNPPLPWPSFDDDKLP